VKAVAILGFGIAILTIIRSLLVIWDSYSERVTQIYFEFAFLGLVMSAMIIGVSIVIWQI